VESEERKKTFYNALMKTKYGDKLKKKIKKKAKKLPLSLKALGMAGMAAQKIKQGDIEYKKKIDKDSSISVKGNPKKKSIGFFFNKSF
tara:strand:- start:134 stop:397 length:264 start_codon:yes stop_codon:yes gene_type:complete